MKRSNIITILLLLAAMVLLSACGRSTTELFQNSMPLQSFPFFTSEPVAQSFTVTFDLNGGSLISGETVQQVDAGEPAVAPEVENGLLALSWDVDFSRVTSELMVTAVWERVELSAVDVAEVVRRSTVTINCTRTNGSTGSGSGFFIDDQGTIVTCYHVINYAAEITVEVFGGGRYDVERIIAFNELNDLAIIKIDLPGSPALPISTTPVRVGEAVYANGSALGILAGTFTSGTVSSDHRVVDGIDCIQMDAAISSGNSGGPLVNSFAEVVGVNAMSFVSGESLNLAIKIEGLNDLNEVNYTVGNYQEWIMREADRSYSPFDGNQNFYYSTVNTYTVVTGRRCDYSVDFGGRRSSGFVDDREYYIYRFVESEADMYVDYLKSRGFEFHERTTYRDGVSYFYRNGWLGLMVDMFQSDGGELWLWVYKV